MFAFVGVHTLGCVWAAGAPFPAAAVARSTSRLRQPCVRMNLLGSLPCSVQMYFPVPPAGADPSVALEQLCWLTTMCSHVLADLGDGETPLVPLPICQACEAAAAGGQGRDPAEQLSAGLLAVGQHCLAHAGQLAASPRCVGGWVFGWARRSAVNSCMHSGGLC